MADSQLYCRGCGAEVPQGVSFCDECGTEVDDSPPRTTKSPAEVLRGLSPHQLTQQLQSMDPYDFEYLVADLWEEMGWETEVSQASVDAGVDVIAEKSTPYNEKKVIQAKRYDDGTRVGSREIQQYASLKHQIQDADSVIVVTTSSFTRSARDRAEDLNVKLVNGDDIVGIIEDKDSYGKVAKYLDTVGTPVTEQRQSWGQAVEDDQNRESETTEIEEEVGFFTPAEQVIQSLPKLGPGGFWRNAGVFILYLMIWPYLLLGLVGYYIYAIGTNKYGIGDMVVESPLGELPTIEESGWEAAVTVLILLLLVALLIVVISSL